MPYFLLSHFMVVIARGVCQRRTKREGGKNRPGSNQACFKGISVSLKLYNIGCLGAFGRVDNVELHLLAFGQRLKTAVLNVAEMNKYISALFTGYESKPFGIIEPLY